MAPSGGAGAAIAELQSTTQKIDGKMLELQAGVNRYLPELPPILSDYAIKLWNKFIKVMREAWDYYWNVVEKIGDPDKLRSVGEGWSKQVSAALSEWQQLPLDGSLAVDDNWDGTAADQYRQGLLAQRTALEKIRTVISEPMVGLLNELASDITWFMWELVGALLVLLAAIITAIATVVTVIGAIAAGIAGGLAFSSAVIGAMIKMKSDANDMKGKLRTAIDDWSMTKAGERRWPQLISTTGVALQPGG